MSSLTINTAAFDLDQQQAATTAALYTSRVGTDPSKWHTARLTVTAGNTKARSRVRSSYAIPVFNALGEFIGVSLATLSIDSPIGAVAVDRSDISAAAISLATVTGAQFGNLKPNPVD